MNCTAINANIKCYDWVISVYEVIWEINIIHILAECMTSLSRREALKKLIFSNQMTNEMAGFVQDTVTSCIRKNAGVSSHAPTHENSNVILTQTWKSHAFNAGLAITKFEGCDLEPILLSTLDNCVLNLTHCCLVASIILDSADGLSSIEF